MEPLVSVEEYRVLTGSTANVAQLRALLVAASSAVLENAHGQEIVEGTSTDISVFNYEGRFYLPQRPVTGVASVTVDGETLEETAYRWTRGGNRRHAVIIRRENGHDSSFTAPEATVTYTHGWAETPGQIVMAIVAMVASSLATEAGTNVTTGETAGPFSEQRSEPIQTPDMGVTASTCAILDRLCGVDRHASVPSSV